jgi:hypothetical protein
LYREYFDSCSRASEFGKKATRRIKYTIRLRHETQHKMYPGPVKLSFCRAGDFMPCSGRCRGEGGSRDDDAKMEVMRGGY